MAARLRSILNEARSEVAPSAAHGLEGKVAALKSLDKLDAKVLSSLQFFVEDRRKDLEAREFVVKNLQSKLALLLRRVRSETERERLQHAAQLTELRKQNGELKSECKRAQDACKAAKSKNATASSKNQELAGALEAKQAELEALLKAQAESSKRVGELQAQVSRFSSDIQNAAAENDAKKRALASQVEEGATRARQEVEAVRKEAAQAQEARDAAEARAKVAEARAMALESRLDAARREARTVETSLSESREAAAKEAAGHAAALSGWETRVGKVADDLSAAVRAATRGDEGGGDGEVASDEMGPGDGKKGGTLSRLESAVATAVRRIDAARSSQRRAAEKQRSLEVKAKGARARAERLEAEMTRKTEAMRLLEMEAARERKARKQAETNAAADSSADTIKRLKAQLMTVRRTMQSTVQRVREDARAELERVKAKLEGDKLELAKSLSQANSHFENAVGNTEKAMATAEKHRNEKARHNEELTQRIKVMVNEIKELNFENERLHVRVRKIAPLEAKVEELKAGLGGLANAKGQVASLTAIQQEVKRAVPKVLVAFERMFKDLTCPRCSKLLAGPTLLAPCGHIVCKECLKPATRAQGKRGGQIRCPACGPKGGKVTSSVLSEHMDRLVGDFIVARKNLEKLKKLSAHLE